MDVFRKLEEVPANFGPAYVSVGNFDGVHRAHAHVLGEIVSRARANDGKAVAVTFEPHPARILKPECGTKAANAASGKIALAAGHRHRRSAGASFRARFVADDSATSLPNASCARDCTRREVHEGFNFRFGHKAAGDVSLLGRVGAGDGIRGEGLSRDEPARRNRFQHADSQVDCRRAREPRAPSAGASVLHSRVCRGEAAGYGSKYTVPTINLARYEEAGTQGWRLHHVDAGGNGAL